MSPPRRTRVTLVTGASGAVREQAILGLLDQTASAASPASDSSQPDSGNETPGPSQLADGAPDAVLLEGLPTGQSKLIASATLLVHQIAPACLCCTGNLVLRVTLNRILRHRPHRLFIGVATTEHLDQLRSWLQSAPYDQLLELTPDCST